MPRHAADDSYNGKPWWEPLFNLPAVSQTEVKEGEQADGTGLACSGKECNPLGLRAQRFLSWGLPPWVVGRRGPLDNVRGGRLREGMYYSLMMSTSVTFGTISALFGVNHQIINQTEFSHLVATVIASAVVPTAIANSYFLPNIYCRALRPRRQ